MELFTGDRRIPVVTGSFPDHIDPFTDGCDWVYGNRQPVDENVDVFATPTSSAPPQKLRPIRYGGSGGEVQITGELEMGLESDVGGCLEGGKVADVADGGGGGGGGGGGVAVENSGRVESGRSSGIGDVWDRTSFSSSADTDDDPLPDVQVPANRKRKRKSRERLEHFMEKLVAKMMEKQEQMYRQLIEMMEKKERERIQREEAWRQQEIEKMKRDEEARTREMSHSLALISLIQTLLGHEIEIPQPLRFSMADREKDENGSKIDIQKVVTGDSNNRRWPEAEVQALIMLRSTLEDNAGLHKVLANSTRGSIWDEISARMREMGYDRSAKKCKEKWENMNKYYRRLVDSGKKHPENSKTCSYFQELDTLYKNGFMNPGNAIICSGNENEAKIEKE